MDIDKHIYSERFNAEYIRQGCSKNLLNFSVFGLLFGLSFGPVFKFIKEIIVTPGDNLGGAIYELMLTISIVLPITFFVTLIITAILFALVSNIIAFKQFIKLPTDKDIEVLDSDDIDSERNEHKQ